MIIHFLLYCDSISIVRIQCLLRLYFILIDYLVSELFINDNTASNKVHCSCLPSGIPIFYFLINGFWAKEYKALKNFIQRINAMMVTWYI